MYEIQCELPGITTEGAILYKDSLNDFNESNQFSPCPPPTLLLPSPHYTPMNTGMIT